MKKTVIVYDPTFKAEAVLMSYKRNNLTKLEQELGLYEGALNRWRKIYEKYGTDGFTKNISLKKKTENYKISKFEKKIKQSELHFEILQNAGKHVNHGKERIFQFMEENEKIYPIRTMSKILGVHRCTYRRWKNRFNNDEHKRKTKIKKEISSIFFASAGSYGKNRIAAALQNTEYKISISTAGRYMRELELYASLKVKSKKILLNPVIKMTELAFIIAIMDLQ